MLPATIPSVKFISELTVPQIQDILKSLNQEDVKIYLFKFLHDIHKAFRPSRKRSGLSEIKKKILDYNYRQELSECTADASNVNVNDVASTEVAEQELIHYYTIGNGTLSSEFFDQLEILRNSCNDFEGLQKKLTQILNSPDQKAKEDLN